MLAGTGRPANLGSVWSAIVLSLARPMRSSRSVKIAFYFNALLAAAVKLRFASQVNTVLLILVFNVWITCRKGASCLTIVLFQ
jgi:hypothetical protein